MHAPTSPSACLLLNCTCRQCHAHLLQAAHGLISSSSSSSELGSGLAAMSRPSPAAPSPPAPQPPPEYDTAQRRVLRSLQLINSKMDKRDGPTMPPLPAHRASFRGNTVQLEVQQQGSPAGGRFKIHCHANEYVGLIRRRLAGMLGVEVQRLRMLYAGGWVGWGGVLGCPGGLLVGGCLAVRAGGRVSGLMAT